MGSGAAASQRSLYNFLDKKNASAFGLQGAYDEKYSAPTAFGSALNETVDRQKTIDANVAEAGKNTDLTGQIIKSVARAEMARKKTGMTRESTFVSERSSAADLDAQRKRYPSQNQYTPKPPPGVK